MDNETINLIKDLFEEYANKDNSTVIAACITVVGMLGVSVLAAFSQWLITKIIVSAEHRKMRAQVIKERFARQHEKWETDIIEEITGLLKATDPEINSEINCATVTGYVLKLQLLLNTDDPNQDRVNKIVNQLAIIANEWKQIDNYSELHGIQDQLLKATGLLVYRPNL
ncbi:MAG: hypothetical protein AB2809_00315 [Candidatus Thiodiazotropha sp.]